MHVFLPSLFTLQRLAEPPPEARNTLDHVNTEAPPKAASAVLGAMPLTASTAGTLDEGEGTEDVVLAHIHRSLRPRRHARRAQRSRVPATKRKSWVYSV